MLKTEACVYSSDKDICTQLKDYVQSLYHIYTHSYNQHVQNIYMHTCSGSFIVKMLGLGNGIHYDIVYVN